MAVQQHARRRTADAEIAQLLPHTSPRAINAAPYLQADARKRSKGGFNVTNALEVTGAIIQTTIPAWLQTGVMIGLIFGGCCSNVFVLEAIITTEPNSGLLITFTQFLLVAITGFYANFSSSNPPFYLKPNRIPLKRWMINIALFFGVNTLNNYAFGFQISVPIHIILRSGGSVTTMVIGSLWGKRYSRMQITSVALLTAGVVFAAWADADAKGKTSTATPQTLTSFITGLVILFTAQIFSAIMGLYIEATYQQYGRHWREGFFYSHFLSLPLFLPFFPSMFQQYQRLAASPPVDLSFQPLSRKVPVQLVHLAINSVTQYACIRGVNLLASKSSALTVTIVLNIRKLASLLLSIWLFGNRLAPGVLLGASVVFGSGALYGWESQRTREVESIEQDSTVRTNQFEKKS